MSEKKIICWRGSDGDVEPVKCICNENFGYPNNCTDETGKQETMYENTHFLNKEDAWNSIVKSVKAGISLSGSSVNRAIEELEKAKAESTKSVLEYYKVRSNMDNPFRGDM